MRARTAGAGAATSGAGSRSGALCVGALAAAGAAVLGAGFLAAAFGAAAGICSRRRRTTGGSTVEDADRTNSPISWSLVITTLLSTPSSFASS